MMDLSEMGTICLLVALCVVLALVVVVFVDIDKQEKRQKEVVIDFLNGKEVKLEGWMFGYCQIDEVAKEWCANHSIPASESEAKCQELVDQFNYAVSNNKITLKPVPTETEAESVNKP